MRESTHICAHLRTYAPIYAYMPAYTNIFISIYPFMHAYMRASVHICRHVRRYARIYAYISGRITPHTPAPLHMAWLFFPGSSLQFGDTQGEGAGSTHHSRRMERWWRGREGGAGGNERGRGGRESKYRVLNLYEAAFNLSVFLAVFTKGAI